MKKSLIRGLFLLSCLFFFSNFEATAQTFRADSEVKSDIPTELTSLEGQFASLDESDPDYEAQIKLLEAKYRAIQLLDKRIGQAPMEDLLKYSLVKTTDMGISYEDFEKEAFIEMENEFGLNGFYSFVFNFLTE